MEILGMRLEMLGKAVDAFGEQCDLDLGRAGICDRSLELFYDLRFLRDLQSHASLLAKPQF